MLMTLHAKKRASQRAIPQVVIELLLDLGTVEHRKRGVDLLYFDKSGKHAARSLMKQRGLTQADHCLKAFLIESSDGQIVTVGHRTKKIYRS